MNSEKGVVAALGTFDGIHKGHLAVLNAALSFKDLYPIVITFPVPPKRYITGEHVPLLMTYEEKEKRLKELGFKEVIPLDYKKIHSVTAEDFLDGIFEKYDIKAVVCGFNYRFGFGGKGDAETLATYCREHSADAVICPETTVSGQPVSSSLIRKLISDGEVSLADDMMSAPFSYKSPVVHGDERGRTIGFPTVNQYIDTELVTPAFGVYVSSVTADGKEYPAVTNIGIRPTFLVRRPISETYIIGYDGDLYGKEPEVKLLYYLRPETKFSGLEELKYAIGHDRAEAIRFFEQMKKQ